MESFNDLLTKWQPFFSTVAGVSATLAGLLFVSLSVNREKIAASNNRVLMRLAQRSFGDLIFALFVAILFLIPAHEPHTLAIPIFILALCRGYLMARSFYRAGKQSLSEPAGFGRIRENAIQVLCWLGLFAAGVAIYRGVILAIFFLVPVISLLLYNGSVNAWSLLVMEKTAEEGQSERLADESLP